MDYAAGGLFFTVSKQSESAYPVPPHNTNTNNIPFSHRCLLRLPSFPFCKASRLLKLSRRNGSRRRNDTVGTFGDVSVACTPDCVTNRTRDTEVCSVEAVVAGCCCDTGTGSSKGIVNGTAAPRRPADRAEVPAVTESVSVRSSSDAVAWSVHAEIARDCCGVRCPWLGEEAWSSGWIAIVAYSDGRSSRPATSSVRLNC